MQNRSITALSNCRTGNSARTHKWTDYLTTHIDNIADKNQLPESLLFEKAAKKVISCNTDNSKLGCLKLERVKEASYKCQRDKKNSSDFLSNPILLVLQISGTVYIKSMSKTECLEPGHMVVIDTRDSFRISKDEPSDQLIVTIPRNRVVMANTITRPHSNRFSCKNGLGKLLYDLLKQSIENYGLLNDSSKTSIAQSVLQIIPIMVENRPSAEDICRGNTGTMIQKVKLYIENSLSDPYLSIEKIAEENHCSVRTIHRLFKMNDLGGVSHHIWNRRAVLAADMLVNPDFSNSSITDIAFRCGFSSSAHFSRIFKSYYGISPREYRMSMSTVN